MYVYSEQLILRRRDVVAAVELWHHDTPQSPHAHEFMEIVVVDSGAAVHRTVAGSYKIGPGAALLVRPGQWHAYDDPHDLRIWNLYIPTKTLALELAALRGHPVLAAFTSARIATPPPAMAEAGSAGPPVDGRAVPAPGSRPRVDLEAARPYFAELARPSLDEGRSLSRLGQLLVVLDLLAPAFAISKPGQNLDATHPAVVAAAELLDASPSLHWTLAELADRAHVSSSYLCRLFTRELGISPLQYLERHRLELTARLLLEGELSISQISASVGWSDTNYMARRFRAAYGMPPSQYRTVFKDQSMRSALRLWSRPLQYHEPLHGGE